VYSYGADLVTPASTMKLVTAAAALESLGPDHRFRTTVVAGVNTRQIVLVGGGDPLLGRAPVSQDVYPARADVRTLAAATATCLPSFLLVTSPASVRRTAAGSAAPSAVGSATTGAFSGAGRVSPGGGATSAGSVTGEG
jgi:D-alanyl-D-alanine carboxypeptidase